jgi:hypothetical protein
LEEMEFEDEAKPVFRSISLCPVGGAVAWVIWDKLHCPCCPLSLLPRTPD